jgi:predicted ATPase
MKISMQNFLAIQDKVEIDLNKINLFIGANNCGKSTLGKLQELVVENRWYTGINSVSDELLNFYSWTISELFNYHALENIINDEAPKKEIVLSFERKLNNISYVIEVKHHKSSFLQTRDGLSEINAAEVIEFKITANQMVLFQVWNDELKIFYKQLGESILALPTDIKSEFFQKNEDFDSLIAQFSYAEDVILNVNELKNKNQFFSGKNPIEILELLSQAHIIHRSKEIIKFINYMSRYVISPLSMWKNISFNNQFNLDYMTLIETNKYLEYFQLQLYKKPLHIKDQKGTEKIVGFDWLLKQNDNLRLLNSYGSGTICLVNFISQLGIYIDSITNFDTSANLRRTAEKGSIVSIVEPEMNLHPDWQIQLTKLLIKEIADYSSIILETHSVHILKTIQVEIAKGKIRSEDVTIHEFYRDEKTGAVRINPMQYEQSGFLKNNGYFKGNFNTLLIEMEKELFLIQQARIQEN